MDISTYERLWKAVDTMVADPGSIQRRLANATIFHLLPLKDQEVFSGHPELQARFDLVIEALVGDAEEGGIEAATGALPDETARQLASEIFALFCKAAELSEN